jgi:hypothetical protein
MSDYEGEKPGRTKTTPSLGDFLVCRDHGLCPWLPSPGRGERLADQPDITPGAGIGGKPLHVRTPTQQAPFNTKPHTWQFRQRLRHGTI